jgi:hypothetical protein
MRAGAMHCSRCSHAGELHALPRLRLAQQTRTTCWLLHVCLLSIGILVFREATCLGLFQEGRGLLQEVHHQGERRQKGSSRSWGTAVDCLVSTCVPWYMQEPGNENYMKALEMCNKVREGGHAGGLAGGRDGRSHAPGRLLLLLACSHARNRPPFHPLQQAPEYYDEIQSHLQAESMASQHAAKKPAPDANEFWWDVGGWVLLAAVIGGMRLRGMKRHSERGRKRGDWRCRFWRGELESASGD